MYCNVMIVIVKSHLYTSPVPLSPTTHVGLETDGTTVTQHCDNSNDDNDNDNEDDSDINNSGLQREME